MSDNVGQSSGRAVESFRYPAVPATGGIASAVLGFGPADHKAGDQALRQEIAAAVEAARKQGQQEGAAQARTATAQALEQERMAVRQAVEDFTAQQTAYFRRVETEAVRLALSIARKVLHREAQMDPLLLAGVVRVALEQVQAGTRLRLRAAPESQHIWSEFCAGQLGEKNIEVVADDHLKGCECVLESELGSTQISLESQLREIESGFFDLLEEKLAAQP